MKKLKIVILLLLFVNLYAQPNLAEIKQAVQANPALLDTPQAKTLMEKNGVSKEMVQEKLNAQETTSTISKTTIEEAKNQIELDDNNQKNIDKKLVKKGYISQKINPFLFNNKKYLDKILGAKQTYITQKKLSRYALNFYRNKNIIDSASLPTPDDYIISTGDVVSIHIYGDRDKNYKLKVENDGSIELPFIGPVEIGGMRFGEAKKYLRKKLKIHL